MKKLQKTKNLWNRHKGAENKRVPGAVHQTKSLTSKWRLHASSLRFTKSPDFALSRLHRTACWLIHTDLSSAQRQDAESWTGSKFRKEILIVVKLQVFSLPPDYLTCLPSLSAVYGFLVAMVSGLSWFPGCHGFRVAMVSWLPWFLGCHGSVFHYFHSYFGSGEIKPGR